MLGVLCKMTKPVLIMTRPAQASRRFADSLAATTLAKLTVLISPLMQIKPVPAAINLEGVEGVVFSSGHGVENAPMGRGRTAYCVGSRTCSMQWSSFSACALAAISGTTPPNAACKSVCPNTTDDKMLAGSSGVWRTIAAAVSSQLLSIPRNIMGRFRCKGDPCQVTP